MKNDPNPGRDPDRHPLDVVAEDFAERCRRGESPSIAEYAERYPEFKEKIEHLFPSIAAMERLGGLPGSRREPFQAKPPTAPVPKQLGDFRIVREIGRGGMGIVYEAVQQSLNRRVAVKLLPRQSLLEPKELLRFEREARTAARLHHTNIVPVFGVGDQDGFHYYVMQFIEGVGLDEVLLGLKQGSSQRQQPAEFFTSEDRGEQVSRVIAALRSGVFLCPQGSDSLKEVASTIAVVDTWKDEESESKQGVEDAEEHLETGRKHPPLDDSAQRTAGRDGTAYCQAVAQIGLQVARALHYAHVQGTLHRDIKPGNLLLDSKGAVWVADFGLAKAMENDDVSRTGDVVGTLRYMAPEQFSGQPEPRSDIYSLGLTLYEMLTLRPAFPDSSRSHLVPDKNRVRFERPRNLNPAVSRDLETIVMKAASPEIMERYATASELAIDLQNYLEDRPIRARRASWSERGIKWCRRNPAVASLSVLAFVLLLMVAVSATIGFLRTNSALGREQTAKKNAVEEKNKAEATLSISLDALDRVYQRFAPDRLYDVRELTMEDGDGQEIVIPTQPVLSPETAVMLEEMLSFYDQFARQNIGSMDLRLEAARANRRVGDIQQRLGAFVQAEAAYDSAIQRYTELSEGIGADGNVLEIARIYNELGKVYRATQRTEEARASHLAALALLRDAPQNIKEEDASQFELAQTLYLLDRRFPPDQPGRPPRPEAGSMKRGHPFDLPSRLRGLRRPGGNSPRGRRTFEYLDEAILILKYYDSRNYPEHRFLLAQCYRERERGTYSESAVLILEELCAQFPGVPDYRFELGETYTALDVRRIREAARSTDLERLRKGVAVMDDLVRQHPQIPKYLLARAHAHHKLGHVLHATSRALAPANRDARIEEAKTELQLAQNYQANLVDRWPDVSSYSLWLAKMQETLVRVLMDQGSLKEAQALAQSSIESLEDFRDKQPTALGVEPALRAHYDSLADVLLKLGQDEAAGEARRQANKFRRSLRDWIRHGRPR